MPLVKIMKRNGKIVDFNETKIRQAIQKAVKATDL
jgi:transcriptional regulator NrdR family protein